VSQTIPGVEITTEISRMDLDRVHDWLARKSYWAGRMPRTVFDRALHGSLCFGAIKMDATVAFARVIRIAPRSPTFLMFLSTRRTEASASVRLSWRLSSPIRTCRTCGFGRLRRRTRTGSMHARVSRR
jgi:hypothetical protein